MSSIFGQSTGAFSLGQNNQQQQNPSNTLGSSTTNAPKPLFGSLNTNTSTSQGQTGGGLFGSASQTQQSGGGLFGSATQPQQSGGGLFGGLGSSTNQQNQQPQQPQQGGSLFGGFGSTNNQQNQQPNQSQQGGGLFGGFGQNVQQQQQNQQQNQQGQPPQASLFGQTQGQPRLFVASENGLRKSLLYSGAGAGSLRLAKTVCQCSSEVCTSANGTRIPEMEPSVPGNIISNVSLQYGPDRTSALLWPNPVG